MPKGETSRPYTRKEKQAVKRQKQRNEFAEKAIKGGASPSTVKRKVTDSAGAKKDSEIGVNRRYKKLVRESSNKSGKEFLSQGESSTQRSRLKVQNVKAGASNPPAQKKKK